MFRFPRHASKLWARLTLAILAGIAAGPSPLRAEVTEVKITRGYGTVYLALMVMEQNQLLEKHAKAAGLGDLKINYLVLDGGNVINDALLTGSLDIAATGVPGFLTLWAKVKGSAQEISALSALSTSPMYLNSTNPKVKTLRDFTEGDRIALPGVKTSLPAGVLQMLVAHEFGQENYAKLDSLTVSLPYPDAMAAMISGSPEITGHMASPPFCFIELDYPHVHRVMSSVDVLGKITLMVTMTSKRFHDANPKVCAAFVAALDEANKFIAANPEQAARDYVAAAKVKATTDDILRVLKDPNTGYSITPDGIMKWADFLHAVGRIKVKPKTWQELFFPEAAGLPGS